jgi:hypothetical protein
MVRDVCEANSIKSDPEKHRINSLKTKENEKRNGLPDFYMRSLTSQWGKWPRGDCSIATQVLIMYVWQWALQNNNLIQICINEGLTKSLHGSQATRLKNTTEGHRVESLWTEGGILRKIVQTLLFFWLGSALSINDHIFMIFLYEGSHTDDNNIKEGLGGG